MAGEFDLKPHTDTWHAFTKLMIFGTGGTILCVALLALFVL